MSPPGSQIGVKSGTEPARLPAVGTLCFQTRIRRSIVVSRQNRPRVASLGVLLLVLVTATSGWAGSRDHAGGLQYHRFGDPDAPVDWDGGSFAIRFTASMN